MMSMREEQLKIYNKAKEPKDSAWDRPVYNPYRLVKMFIYEHFRYSWFHKVTDAIFFDPIDNTIAGVANIIRWLPVIWQDRNWDEHYILTVLQRKIEIQRNYLVRHNRHMNIGIDNRDMTIVLNLIERVKLDHYEMEYMDYYTADHWFEEAGEHKGEKTFSWESKVTSERFDEYLAKYKSSLRAVLAGKGFGWGTIKDPNDKHEMSRRVAHYNQEKARKLLFRILHDCGGKWWD